MNTLCYECFSGISGDMNLGAMIDLGVDKDYLISELRKLKLPGWEMRVEKDQRHGITGTKVTVVLTEVEKKHRHLADIENIIEKSSLSKAVKAIAMAIFRKVAEAEAKVHDIPVDKVHFHEVGAVDSIIDIAGAAICYINLGIKEVIVSPVELGSGFVRCAHGLLPVPAPATAEIIKGIPVNKGRVDFEATTPTGAAIISTLGTRFESEVNIKIHRTGYGIGQRNNPDLPNLLRVYLGESAVREASGHMSYLVESNIDDMNPEMYENLVNKLFEAGAADVFLTNIIMKRSRPGIKVSIICGAGDIEAVKETFFSNSSTLGLRITKFDKHTASRQMNKIDTAYGPVTVKYAYHNNKLISAKPEISECIAIAEKNKLPLAEVYNNIIAVIHGSKR
ncbi:MAG TPA: nickel pincer cofactor biosynthesis protein LarC [Bacteroidetes bacterium]|nr:nickel pincer cofactor biosynthesis protein LarC [Bacteroidota bacterium]